MSNYVLDDNNNKIPAYSKEEVLAVIEQAIADGSLANLVADAAFISKIKCCVGGDTHPFAFITQAKYNELVAQDKLVKNCYYIITDDTTADDINKTLETINKTLKNIEIAQNKMPKRIFTNATGVDSVSVSDYINDKGYFIVTLMDELSNYHTCILKAVTNAFAAAYIRNDLMAEVSIASNMIMADSICLIVAVDYYEAI